ncbi:hypothetical protein BUALT_Bualt15G0133600 [Buddleja alternifolia]|uniref:Hypoxanthine phosphoribosyltransferase n=1 Tax=Buddleja alternifolia TaxID=168488 RepID=A0AAV6WDA5_9LAMI|nr:hypothetical protein BUALT_Bualt15G0133600 [Buddleja alternifolia]
MEDNIEKILWTENEISERVTELGSQITRDFKSETVAAAAAPAIVGVATGAFVFVADLVRKIHLPIPVDFIRVGSYGSGTISNAHPTISSSFQLKLDIRGLHVILVEDIVDTGNTLSCLIDYMKSKGASSVSVCTLLDKPARRKVHFELVGEGKYYCGFECPDYFVVGYGMDFGEIYRNLPYVGVLKPEIYKS